MALYMSEDEIITLLTEIIQDHLESQEMTLVINETIQRQQQHFSNNNNPSPQRQIPLSALFMQYDWLLQQFIARSGHGWSLDHIQLYGGNLKHFLLQHPEDFAYHLQTDRICLFSYITKVFTIRKAALTARIEAVKEQKKNEGLEQVITIELNKKTKKINNNNNNNKKNNDNEDDNDKLIEIEDLYEYFDMSILPQLDNKKFLSLVGVQDYEPLVPHDAIQTQLLLNHSNNVQNFQYYNDFIGQQNTALLVKNKNELMNKNNNNTNNNTQKKLQQQQEHHHKQKATTQDTVDEVLETTQDTSLHSLRSLQQSFDQQHKKIMTQQQQKQQQSDQDDDDADDDSEDDIFATHTKHRRGGKHNHNHNHNHNNHGHSHGDHQCNHNHSDHNNNTHTHSHNKPRRTTSADKQRGCAKQQSQTFNIFFIGLLMFMVSYTLAVIFFYTEVITPMDFKDYPMAHRVAYNFKRFNMELLDKMMNQQR